VGGGDGEQEALAAGDRKSGSEVASAGRALRKCRTERRQERGGGVLGLDDERVQLGRVIHAENVDIR
jgi:hypothetical protein